MTDRCPRCQGYLHHAPDRVYCLNCSFHPPLTPRPTVYRETGSQCECSRQTDGVSGTCKLCRYSGHAAKIKAGQLATKVQRICRRDECEVLCEPGLHYCPDHRPPIRVQRVRRNGPILPVVQEATP